MTQAEIRWKCNECCATYEDKYDAAYCCGPYMRWACPVCHDDGWEDEADALACCYTGDEEDNPAKPTAEELERAGQQRLIP